MERPKLSNLLLCNAICIFCIFEVHKGIYLCAIFWEIKSISWKTILKIADVELKELKIIGEVEVAHLHMIKPKRSIN